MSIFLAISLLWLVEMFLLFLFFEGAINKPDTFFSIFEIVCIGLLSNLAFSFLGVQASALSVHSSYPWMLLFLIFLPLSLPITINASKLTATVLDQQKNENILHLYFNLVSFNLIYAAVGIMLYEKFLEE